MLNHSSKRMSLEGLKVSPESDPDWISCSERLPELGEIVRCTGGLGEVIKLHGKTGNGSRLIELRLLGEKAPPFYAAASNLLVKR